MSDNVHELKPRRADPVPDLLHMEEDLRAVKNLAFAINMIASSDNEMYIQDTCAKTLWQIAHAIERHASALIEQWEAAVEKQGGRAR